MEISNNQPRPLSDGASLFRQLLMDVAIFLLLLSDVFIIFAPKQKYPTAMTSLPLRISDFQFWGLLSVFALAAFPILYVFQRVAGLNGDFDWLLTEEDKRTLEIVRRAKAVNRIRKRHQKYLRSVRTRKLR